MRVRLLLALTGVNGRIIVYWYKSYQSSEDRVKTKTYNSNIHQTTILINYTEIEGALLVCCNSFTSNCGLLTE